MSSQFTANGFKIQPFGKGRNPIQVEFANELIRALNALGRIEIEVVNAGENTVIYSDGRIVFQLNASATGIAGGMGTMSAYKVKSDSGDYLVCRTWNGTDEGVADVNIAKPHSARQPASETVGGVTYNYTYSAGPDSLNDQRSSDDGATQEDQIVTPLWVADGLIQVVETNFSGVTVEGFDLSLIEVSARCWAKIVAA